VTQNPAGQRSRSFTDSGDLSRIASCQTKKISWRK